MCPNFGNENYRTKCPQYAPKIKNRIKTLALEYDWPETKYMEKNEKTLRGGGGVLGREF